MGQSWWKRQWGSKKQDGLGRVFPLKKRLPCDWKESSRDLTPPPFPIPREDPERTPKCMVRDIKGLRPPTSPCPKHSTEPPLILKYELLSRGTDGGWRSFPFPDSGHSPHGVWQESHND